jgi:hypothetical protein
MVHGTTDVSNQHCHERLVEKRERPSNGGMERKKSELGWKITGERPKHIGRIRPEKRSQGGHKWRALAIYEYVSVSRECGSWPFES